MFSLPSAIFYEAFLSFIGLGLQPPYASLGVLINEGFQALQNYPYDVYTIYCSLFINIQLKLTSRWLGMPLTLKCVINNK